MIKVIVLGSGNVATHLTKTFLKKKKVDLVQVYSRNIKNIEYLNSKTAITDSLKSLKNADVYIISISDDAIATFSKQLSLEGKLVVHTSGSIEMNELKGNYDKGVFYPLQTFSKDKKIKFKKIPICIESEKEEHLVLLKKLASYISKNISIIDSKQRMKLHLSAVFVNNFVNHLYHIGNEICDENDVSFNILQPLIKETVHKIEKIKPIDAQTGPAKRNDTNTIEKHLNQLTNHQQKIYKTLTDSILKTYK